MYTLQNTGFEAVGCADGEEFFKILQPENVDAALLDIMLPGMSGIDILKKLRSSPATSDIPVIMISARGTEYDKVVGLDSGADDYISKPFGMMELTARVRALLRRTGKTDGKLAAGEVSLYPDSRTVTVSDDPVTLSFKEFELLEYLLRNKGRAVARSELLDAVWSYEYEGETRTVDVHIRTLRQKLGEGGGIIETVRGVGYKITDN